MHILFYILVMAFPTHPAQKLDCAISQGQAYQRATIPGNMPRKDLDESGKEVDAPVKKMNTIFSYVETKNNCTPTVTRLWIDGKVYHTIQEEIRETPVLAQSSHPGGKFDTLVKKTNNKVFRIHPREELSLKPGKEIAQAGKCENNFENRKIRPDYYSISRT